MGRQHNGKHLHSYVIKGEVKATTMKSGIEYGLAGRLLQKNSGGRGIGFSRLAEA
jgi:deoxyhypusine synthase